MEAWKCSILLLDLGVSHRRELPNFPIIFSACKIRWCPSPLSKTAADVRAIFWKGGAQTPLIQRKKKSATHPFFKKLQLFCFKIYQKKLWNVVQISDSMEGQSLFYSFSLLKIYLSRKTFYIRNLFWLPKYI